MPGMMGKGKGKGMKSGKPGTGGPMPPQMSGMPRGYKSGGMVKPKGKK